MGELIVDWANHFEIGILLGAFLVVVFHNVKVRLEERQEAVEHPIAVPVGEKSRRRNG